MNTPLLGRRSFLQAAAGAGIAVAAPQRPPNIVIIYADDLGYGDLGCYGSNIRTPNLDRMAAEGMRFTAVLLRQSGLLALARGAADRPLPDPRAACPACSFPPDTAGLSRYETTIAAMLEGAGYETMCIGKWHLGHPPQYLPTSRGFDEYFGIPYSNDMTPRPLLHNTGNHRGAGRCSRP